MTVTITWFSVGTNLGPGMWLDVHTDLVGPLEDLAYATADIVDPALGGIICRGSKYLHGGHTATVTLGRFEGGNDLAPASEGAQVGLSVRIQARVFNSSHALIDGPVTLATAFAWVDSSAWYLQASTTVDLAPVLAAVQHVYQNAH